MYKSESTAKLAPALLKAQTQMGNATKESKNPFFKSSYANLNSVREAVTPALNANGITVLQPTVELSGNAFVETVLLHESGEWLSGLTQIVVGKQNDPQAAGSGISYARRYGLQSLLSIGAEDDDGEAAMGRGAKTLSTAPQKPTVLTSEKMAEVAKGLHNANPNAIVEKPTSMPEIKTSPVILEAPKKTTFRKPAKEAHDAPTAGGNGWE